MKSWDFAPQVRFNKSLLLLLFQNLLFCNLPTTCIFIWAVAVENDGASAVTSHEKLPDNPNPTFRITTWLAFDSDSCKWMRKNILWI